MDIIVNKIEIGNEIQPTVLEFNIDLGGALPGIQSVTSTDNHIQVDNTDYRNPKLSFTLVDNENFVTDDEKAVIQNTSGINTGDQDLSPYATNEALQSVSDEVTQNSEDITDLQSAVSDIESGLPTKQDKTDNLLETDSKDIVGAINEVNAIAKQASNGRVFATVAALDSWLLIPENVALLEVGDAFYIVELDVPDYWWDGTQKQELETQKVDLSQYYTSSQIDTLLENYYTSSEIDTILSGYALAGHDHSGEVINPDAIKITKIYSDAEIAALPTNTLFWDDANNTYGFKVPDGGVIQINQEPHDYYTNLEGAQINEMYVVSSCGASGNRTAVCLTDATDNTKSQNCIGMVTVTSIGANQVGRITKSGGKVRGLNTDVVGWTEGDTLYVHQTVKGTLTNVEPPAGTNKVRVGTLTVKHQTQGVIELNIHVESRLDNLVDVDGTDTTIADTDVILKKDASLWKKVTWSNVKTLLNGIYAKLAGGNTFTGTQNFSNVIQHIVGEFLYDCASFTADTINDRRYSNIAGVYKNERCTVANATKGSGTWVVDIQVNSDSKIILSNSIELQDLFNNGTLDPFFFAKGGYSTGTAIKIGNQFGYLRILPFQTDSTTYIQGSQNNMSFSKNGGVDLTRLSFLAALTSFSGHFNLVSGKYTYNATSPTSDTVNDTRTYISSGARIFERCTVANATKGSGTWVEDMRIDATGKLQFSGTARKKWNKYTAQSITFTTGSTADNISTLQSGMDGTYMTISEVTGAPGIDAYVEFTGVTAFERVRLLAAYVGTTSHQIMIQVYDWANSAWRTFNTMETSAFDTTNLQFKNNEFTVYDDTNYIGTSANAGKVRVRLYHPITGNATHRLYIDELSLRQ